MKKKVLFGLLLIIAIPSCNSDSGYNGWDIICKGTIQFVNNSSNPYYVSVSGYGTFTLPGRTSVEKEYDKGSYVIDVKQKSGYLLYPTEETYTVKLGCGDHAVCSFPEPGILKGEEE